jgi:hypothetical protein
MFNWNMPARRLTLPDQTIRWLPQLTLIGLGLVMPQGLRVTKKAFADRYTLETVSHTIHKNESFKVKLL